MFRTILIPIDLSDPENYHDALDVGTALAKQYGSKLRLVTVVAGMSAMMAEYLPENTQDRVIDEAKSALNEMARETGFGSKVSTVVREGTVHHEVIEEARDAEVDLIVMGSHKPRMATYFLGSHATMIVRHAPCSVMVLRSPE